MTDLIALAAAKAWPLCGYAPGHYSGKCHDCGTHFEGDKRAMECLECAARSANFLLGDARDKLRDLAAVVEKLEPVAEAAALLLEVHEAMGAGNSPSAVNLRTTLNALAQQEREQ